MNFFKKIFLIFCVSVMWFSLPQISQAQNLFGYNDPPGCGGDYFLPNLVICGRSPSVVGANCQQFTKPCSVGDLVETGKRLIVWIISMALLIVPLFVMYYGAMIVVNQQWDGNIDVIKKARSRLKEVFIYFIFLLAAWLIVRTVVDIFQVEKRINTFLIDENGNPVEARTFNTN